MSAIRSSARTTSAKSTAPSVRSTGTSAASSRSLRSAASYFPDGSSPRMPNMSRELLPSRYSEVKPLREKISPSESISRFPGFTP